MGKLALVLASLALAGAAWAVCSVERARPSEDSGATAAIDARLATIERTLADLASRPAPAPLLAAPPASGGLVTGGGSPTLGPLLQGVPKAAPTLDQRVAELEKQVARAKEEAGRAAEGFQVAGAGAQVFSPPGFWGTPEAAAKALKLDSVQASRLEGIVESTQRELDALFAKPNEEGVLWKDVNQGLTLEGGEPGDLMGKIGEHMKKVAKFKGGKVPGTNETYAEAERRIRKDGKDRARSLLDADQAKVWDRSHPDALFHGGSSDSFGVITTMTDAVALPAIPAR